MVSSLVTKVDWLIYRETMKNTARNITENLCRDQTTLTGRYGQVRFSLY